MSVRDAATLILLNSKMEVFMVKRHSKSGFMANAWVYPGGGIDLSDSDPRLLARCKGAETLGSRMEESPGRAATLALAVIREAFEEAGILLGMAAGQPIIHSAPFQEHRQSLNAGTRSFVDIAEAEDLTFQLDTLGFFSHWITPTFEARRYDTRFFVALAPEQDGSHDSQETTDSCWVLPRQALLQGAEKEWFLAPPTVRTLEQIAQYDSFEKVLEKCHMRRPPRILPHLQLTDTRCILVLPGDPEFPNEPEYTLSEPVDDDVTRMEFDLPRR